MYKGNLMDKGKVWGHLVPEKEERLVLLRGPEADPQVRRVLNHS
jgi:hypothetical protein